MESILILAVTGIFTVTLVSIPLRSAGILGKWVLSGLCGFLCLWLLNTASAVTGIVFPMNAVTVALASVLGLPGIGLVGILSVI